jgi:Lrp/AsnC family transcriptional regulator, leucine-responsive regulatory protein
MRYIAVEETGVQLIQLLNALEIDDIDRRIIEELVEDGRLAIAELGRRLNLSPPAVGERLKRLERNGVITGYRAEVDLAKLGYGLTAIVQVKPSTPGQLPKIPELARQIPEVGECHRITGEDCFYLKLHLRSIEELSDLLDRFLTYGQTTTSIVNGTPIPLRTPPIRSR